ncbi:MAG: Gfo/Idh/MocA family oxidoreductase [Caldilineaceae bacterium]
MTGTSLRTEFACGQHSAADTTHPSHLLGSDRRRHLHARRSSAVALETAPTSTWRPSTVAPGRRPRRWPSAPRRLDLYTDLDALLARPGIAAVDIALPSVQPDVLRRALAAGKHVLSEKPIAPDHARAQALMQLRDAVRAGVDGGRESALRIGIPTAALRC